MSLVLGAMPALQTIAPGYQAAAQSIGGLEELSRRPGHVIQDRRDELRGGVRPRLRGLDPRPRLEPRSRVRPVTTSIPEMSVPDITPPRARSRLPKPMNTAQKLAACAARYQSFNEATGTYTTFRGVERRCPFLE